MIDPLAFVLAVGAPLLILIYYVEGLVIGKVLQPPAVFVGYIAVTDPSPGLTALVAVGCALAATFGQWTLYRGFNDNAPEILGLRRYVPYLDTVPDRVMGQVGERRMAIVQRVFYQWGAVGIAGTNALPAIRGFVTIPAGLSRYPVRPFVLASTTGNLIYVAILVGVAWGLLEAIGFLFGA